MRDEPGCAAWLANLDDLVDAALVRFRLTRDGAPIEGGSVSLVLPVRSEDGARAVLKLQWPHAESEYEAAALAAWDGRGAVRLVDHDPELRALVLERCEPGTPLAARSDDVVLDALFGLVPRLAVDADAPFLSQAQVVEGWEAEIRAGREFLAAHVGHAVLDDVPAMVARLRQPRGAQVLAHIDLHPGNVLDCSTRGWLAIDPKPMVGDRECGVVSILRSSRLGHDLDSVRARLGRAARELGLDRDRARDFALLQLLAWSTDGPHVANHLLVVPALRAA